MMDDKKRESFFADLISSYSFLFERKEPGKDKPELKTGLPAQKFLTFLGEFLRESARGENAVFSLNSLLLAAREEKALPSFALLIQELIRESLQEFFPPSGKKEEEKLFLKECEKVPEESFTAFALEKAILFRENFRELFALYEKEVSRRESTLIVPLYKAALNSLRSTPELTGKILALQLLTRSPYFERSSFSNPFMKGKIYRYREGKFLPSPPLGENRKIGEFYGYNEAKQLLREHLEDFAASRHNLPLFLTGLPGLGKTRMTIAHILNGKFTLILATPEDLQKNLEELILALSPYPEEKFILFFDDINVAKTDFYIFRTFVGGAFTLPENILTILSANEPFPANIASRGRAFSFPLFDEIRCMEMIGDYFQIHYGSDRGISRELISVIAADYVESYGQKIFEELSPRTLCRYLELYLCDAKRRKRLLSLSNNAMIPRPDAQAFYEQNVRLLKSLYGEEEWEKFQKEEWNLL